MDSASVLVLFNKPVLPADHPDAESEADNLKTVRFVARELKKAGFAVSRLGISNEPGPLLSRLRRRRPDVVFNLFEGTADDGKNEAYVAGLLDWLKVPFTGCPPQALSLAHNKQLAKQLFRGAGLSTPDFLVVDQLPVPTCPLAWPVIVKPALMDASVGLDQGSVVSDQKSLDHRVAYLLERYGGPVLVEEFIRGRELVVAMAENPELRTLPISEIQFLETAPDYWPIVTYDAKWAPESRDYLATPTRFPDDLSAELAEELRSMARQAFRLLGCRDYARADFRVTAEGKPYLLEVNPNPDFGPGAGFCKALAAAGINHAKFAVDLVRQALVRASSNQASQPHPHTSALAD